MKKLNQLTTILLVLAFAGLSNVKLSAQACPSGTWMIGGEIAFLSQSFDGESTSVFSAAPMAGYFIINNLAIGASVDLTTADGFSEFGIGPFVRYYVWSNLFAQAGLQYTSSKVDPFDAVNSTRFGGGVGYSFFVNSAVAIEPSVQVDFGDEITNIGIGIGIQAFLGRE